MPHSDSITSNVSAAAEPEQNVEQSLAGGVKVVTDVAASNDSKETTPSPVSDASSSAQDEAIKRHSEVDIVDVAMLPATQFIPKGPITLPTQTKKPKPNGNGK